MNTLCKKTAGWLFGLILAGTCFAAPPAGKDEMAKYFPDNDPTAKKRYEVLKQRVADDGGKATIVFMGDSLTEFFERSPTWAEKFPGALNLGIQGDGTGRVIWRLDNGHSEGLKPKTVVLLIGTNNGRDTPEERAANIKLVLEKVEQKFAKAMVVLVSIPPRGEGPDDQYNKSLMETNKLIKKFADNKKVLYFDLAKLMVYEKGKGFKGIGPDKIHFSEEGYKLWAANMKLTPPANPGAKVGVKDDSEK